MKKINIPSKTNNSFIGAWKIDDDELFKSIIDFFEANPDLQLEGESYMGMNKEFKDSVDIPIQPIRLKEKKYEIFNKYMSYLNECYWNYLKDFKIEEHFKDLHIGAFNLQKYNQGGHFKSWHSERMNIISSQRVFAWMTYLNDVQEEGETEFHYFDIKIKPIKGLTLIWPSEWTHLHKGSITNEIKYILTGWLHFPDNISGV